MTTTAPSLTLSPSLTFTSLTTPAADDGTSIVALSDSSVTSASSTFTVSPTLTKMSMTGTESKSPMSGTFTSTLPPAVAAAGAATAAGAGAASGAGALAAAAPASTEAVSPLKALSSPWAIFGALAIFLYVGSEVAIGGMLTNFLESPEILNAPIETAGKMVALYWGGAMVGRFIGSLVLTKVRPGVVLAFCTVAAAVLCLTVSQIGGPTAAYAVLSIGLFNSIMFPTIFTLTLERSTAPTSATSGLLVFGIIGGALLPQVAAHIADAAGKLQPAFIVPMLGYVGLTIFAIGCIRTKARTEVTSTASH